MMRKLFATAALVTLLCLDGVSAVPNGFEDTEVIRSLSFPTKFTFTPDGHKMLVSLKRGTILVFNDPDGDWSFDDRSIALEFPEDMLCFNGERGVQTIELHPDFSNNRLVYIYYNYPKNGNCDEDDVNGPVNRLSTFYFGEDDKIDLDSEVVLFETPPSLVSFHNGGDIWMGKDGMLYITIGEGGRTEVAQDPSNLLGAMVRITPDGEIPDDNPFSSVNREMSARCNVTGYLPTDTPDGFKCQEIYAIGLRNPFRFAMDPNTSGDKVRYYINDVGASMWEEINEGGHDFAGPDRIVNYGYPEREGPCRHSRISGCDGETDFEDPIHYYQHDNGGACTAGAFIPNGLWPDEYNSGYLYAEFVHGKMYLMKDSGIEECQSCEPPMSNKDVSEFLSYDYITVMRFGPYKDTLALYYAVTGGGGGLRRVVYVGDGNRSPEAIIEANTTTVQPGGTVFFNATNSSDLDGDALTYEWDFDGDDVVDSFESQAEFTFVEPGVYYVELVARDNNGGEGKGIIEITVGNPPVPVITSPPEGTTFAVGDIFTVVGSALDAEDGVLGNVSLSWEVLKHHDTHYHPFLDPTIGNNFTIPPAFSPEDYYAATNSYIEIILTATDADGLYATVSRNIQPRKVLLEFDTEPSGLDIYLDGTVIVTPANATSWEAHELKIEAKDQIINGVPYIFNSWSNNGTQSHYITIPPVANGLPKLVAKFNAFVEGSDVSLTPTRTPSETPKCLPCSLGIVAGEAYLLRGIPFINQECGVYAIQQSDGNLVVRHGTPDNVGVDIWDSEGYKGAGGNTGDYYTTLQGDGSLITWAGTPDNQGSTVWNTSYVGELGDYFLGIDCNLEIVSVYQGTANNPGGAVWNSAPTPMPTTSPTLAPIAAPPPTLRPTSRTSYPATSPTGTNSTPSESEPAHSDGSTVAGEASPISSGFGLNIFVGISLPLILLQWLS